jgi:2-methylcitrate dehydratase PrpD
VGLSDFTDAAVKDPAVLAVAAKVHYVVNPDDPYPNNFTGHVRALMQDGCVIEERQPHLRGGSHEPLTRQDIEDKFVLNARHGGWPRARIASALARARTLYDGPLDLSAWRE